MTVFKLILAIHILGGSLSLLAGALALILKKGTAQHKLWGNLFFYGMLGSGLASLVLAVLHPNVMLFCIGVFSVYLVLSGKRALYFRSAGTPKQPKIVDYLLIGTMVVFGLTSIGIGVYEVVKGEQLGIVMAVFGGIGLSLSVGDIRQFKQAVQTPKGWLISHVAKMIGGYIAATTAFLVVNNTVLPSLVAWLLPTVLGTALIVKWRRKLEAQRG